MSASEFQKMEINLVAGLENELDLVTKKIAMLMNYLNTAENCAIPVQNTSHAFYLAQVNLFGRLTSHKSRLLRAHHQLIDRQNQGDNLEHIVYQISQRYPDQTDNLLPQFDCSCKNFNFFYSKLFRKYMDLTDDQWNFVKDILPQKINSGAGRPTQSPRGILGGIFWKLRTAASWNDLPPEYPSHQTCYRYYASWVRDGVLDAVVKALARHLSQTGFDLYMALKKKDIELVPLPGRTRIFFSPPWQGTWQASTALLILQVLINRKRKMGAQFHKIDPSSPPSDSRI
jgi:transposase